MTGDYQVRYLTLDGLEEHEAHPMVTLQADAMEAAIIEAVAFASDRAITANAFDIYKEGVKEKRVNI